MRGHLTPPGSNSPAYHSPVVWLLQVVNGEVVRRLEIGDQGPVVAGDEHGALSRGKGLRLLVPRVGQ
jgi:hypothetical protein